MTEYGFYGLITVILFFKMFANSARSRSRANRFQDLPESRRREILRSVRTCGR